MSTKRRSSLGRLLFGDLESLTIPGKWSEAILIRLLGEQRKGRRRERGEREERGRDEGGMEEGEGGRRGREVGGGRKRCDGERGSWRLQRLYTTMKDKLINDLALILMISMDEGNLFGCPPKGCGVWLLLE